MEKMNHTKFTQFIILGFFELADMQLLLFLIFLIIYLMSLTGNLLIIFTVCSASNLHSPMFFFLINLSILEICYVTVTVPKLLAVLIAQNKTILFIHCMIQMYLFQACTDVEFNLLTAMAYDRYIAICNPLRYTIIMNKKVCIILATVSWIISFINPLPHVILVSQLSFCRSNEINHFFCDLTALMTLSCSETNIIEIITYIESPFVGFTPFILTIMSYVYIVSAVLNIHSAKGYSRPGRMEQKEMLHWMAAQFQKQQEGAQQVLQQVVEAAKEQHVPLLEAVQGQMQAIGSLLAKVAAPGIRMGEI
ncbi:olfactory receptor 5V1-like [Microcaecilia unicolor]|uniref:Olfactory receptor n=1 Tax=Microcaecilia unicolor TaxID=1415580 RepID=A0A6P7YGR4_9AMPH|nr:olfactory receptor 5V1-like [Microcaecilia unicolor]